MTVTTPLQGGLNSMGCPDVVSSVAGCVTQPLPRAGQLVQQWQDFPSNMFSVGRAIQENMMVLLNSIYFLL